MGQDQLDKFLKEQLENHSSPIESDEIWAGLQQKNTAAFDQEIKERLFDHETDIDSDVLWKNINKKQNPSSHVPKALILSLVALIVIGGFLLFNKYKTIDNTTSKTNIQNSADQSVDSPSQETKKLNTSSTEILSNTSSTAGISRNEAQAETNAQEGGQQNTSSGIRQVSTEVTFNNSNTAKTSKEVNNPLNLNTNLSLKDKERSNDVKDDLDAVIKSEKALESGSSSSSFTSNDQNFSKGIIIAKTESENSNFSDKLESKSLSLISLEKLLATKNQITLASLDQRNFETDLPQLEHCFRKTKSIDCYDHRGKRSWFYLTGYSTVDYYQKSMKTEDEYPDLAYVDARKITQSFKISMRAGIQLKWLHKNGLFIKSGIEFGLLREQFKHVSAKKDTALVVIPNQLLNIDIDANQDTTLTYGNKTDTIISAKNWDVNNKLQTIGIPLIVGYQTKFKKIHIAAELGALYNINHNFEGYLLSPSIDAIEAKDYFIKNNDLNITGGVSLIYNINPRFNWTLIGSFRRNLNSINQSSQNFINQKNTTFGVGLGIEMKI